MCKEGKRESENREQKKAKAAVSVVSQVCENSAETLGVRKCFREREREKDSVFL